MSLNYDLPGPFLPHQRLLLRVQHTGYAHEASGPFEFVVEEFTPDRKHVKLRRLCGSRKERTAEWYSCFDLILVSTLKIR